jgi:sphinganine-1-phosphate aldolase
MDIKDIYFAAVKYLDPRIVSHALRVAEKVPYVKELIEGEYRELASEMQDSLHPYDDDYEVMSRIPEEGRDRDEILSEMRSLSELEDGRWKAGLVSGAVYHGGKEHVDFLNEVYAVNSQTNPLHSDLWPRIAKYEAEIVSMTARMLNGPAAAAWSGEAVSGVVTSGGTESIMLAVKAYRDHALKYLKIKKPEIVVPSSAHAAFDKAAECFDMRIKHINVGKDYRADVKAMRKALTSETVLLVGSAPCFPHGVIDPIEELAGLALERGIGFHTDACLGGFMLPFAEALGYDVPPFDFRVAGVTSMSADTHKYGYAPKGTSVVLYAHEELMHCQYFKTTTWPGGVYFTPTFAGSRPGSLIAGCWASMVAMGRSGYVESARAVLATADEIKAGITDIPGIELLGEPLWVIAFTSTDSGVYEVVERMSDRGWNLNTLQNPPAAHLCITLAHARENIAGKFLADLREASAEARGKGVDGEEKTALYGLATTFPDKRLVDRGLDIYMDTLYRVRPASGDEKV